MIKKYFSKIALISLIFGGLSFLTLTSCQNNNTNNNGETGGDNNTGDNGNTGETPDPTPNPDEGEVKSFEYTWKANSGTFEGSDLIVPINEDLSFTLAKGSSTTNLVNDKDEIRCYKGSELRFASSNSKTFLSITFKFKYPQDYDKEYYYGDPSKYSISGTKFDDSTLTSEDFEHNFNEAEPLTSTINFKEGAKTVNIAFNEKQIRASGFVIEYK